MKTASHLAGILSPVLAHPPGGVAGLVDDLLAACREHGLQLDWQADRCRVRSGEGDWEELNGLPLRRSVFRAVLARVAALCNERALNSVSPYGGRGELMVGGNPPVVVRVAFANTAAEQKLELTTEVASAAESSQRDGRAAATPSPRE